MKIEHSDSYVSAMQAAMRNMEEADSLAKAGRLAEANALASATSRVAMMLAINESLFHAIHDPQAVGRMPATPPAPVSRWKRMLRWVRP